jgi:hypothetical protein
MVWLDKVPILLSNFMSSQLMNDNLYAFSFERGLLDLSIDDLEEMI